MSEPHSSKERLSQAREYAAAARKVGYGPYRTINKSWLVILDDEIERLRAALERIKAEVNANHGKFCVCVECEEIAIEALRPAVETTGEHS